MRGSKNLNQECYNTLGMDIEMLLPLMLTFMKCLL